MLKNTLIPNLLLMPKFFYSFSDGGDGGDKGGAGDVAKLEQQLKEANAKLESAKGLEAKVNDLAAKLSEADKALLSDDYLTYLESKKENKGKPGAETIDFDDMSPSQIVKHMTGEFEKLSDKGNKTIQQQINQLSTMMSSALAALDVQITGVKHPEFGAAWETEEEKRDADQKHLVSTMKKLSKENTKWSASKCYSEAMKSIKAEKLAEQEAKERKEKEDLAMLGEKGGQPVATVLGKTPSKSEAGDLAWQKHFGNKEQIS